MEVSTYLNGEEVVVVSMEQQRLTAFVTYIDAPSGSSGNLKITEIPLIDLPQELAIAPPVQMTLYPVYDANTSISSVIDWSTVWTSPSANQVTDNDGTNNLSAVNNAAWAITRSFLSFAVSGLSGKDILNAQLRIHGWKTAFSINVCAQEGTQSNPLLTDAFDFQSFTGPLLIDSFGSWDNTDWNDMDLNAAGISHLQGLVDVSSDYVTICMREYDHDYLNVAATQLLIAYCYMSEDAVLKPELVVTYFE